MAIYTKLMSHQKLILKFIKDKEYSAIFADYGTGKTLCALALIEVLQPNIRKILVVSSKTSILSTWPQEIQKHSDFKYVHLLGAASQRLQVLSLGLRKSYTPATPYSTAVRSPILFLINFDGVRSIYNELAQANFDLIIVDESTKIKSPKAVRTKVLWGLGREVPQRIIMTGFPITENMGEIYPQIKFLDQGKTFGNSYYAFLEKYFYKAGFKRLPRKDSEKKIFSLIKPFAIRVTNEVLDLPPQVYEVKEIEPSAQQIDLLLQLKTYFAVEFGNVKIDTQYIFTLINKSLQICDGFIQEGWYKKKDEESYTCSKCKTIFVGKKIVNKSKCPKCEHGGHVEAIYTAKDEVLVDIVEDINPTKNKVLIWAAFRFSVRKLKKLLSELGYNVLTLTGETENVNQVVQKFQNSKTHNILIATQKKASESITLTACRYAIYYSNTWSYDLRANSEARIRRKGSEKHSSIIYTDLFLKTSIEQTMYSCLRKKKDLVSALKTEFRTIQVKEKK